MKPDAFIRVRFKTPKEGGRHGPLTGGMYACPMVIDGDCFDCRLVIKDKEIPQGIWHDLPVLFLNRKSATSRLFVGKKVTLWEGKDIADGVVIRIDP